MLGAFWQGWGAAESLSFLRTEIAVVAESPKCSHLSLGWPTSPVPPAAFRCFPMPNSYETPTTYRTAVSWEEGKFQEWCGREQDGACSWVPGQSCWLISSCDWGLGVALKWGSLSLASLAVFNCWSLFQADGSSPVAGRSVAMGWRERSRKASQGWGGARPLLPAVSHVDMLHSEQCKIPLDLNQMQVSLTSLSQWELGSQCYFQEAFLILPSDSEIRSLIHMTKSVRLDGVLSVLSAPHLACEPAQLLPWLPATVHPPQRSTIFICFSSGYGTAGFLWQSQEQWREWLILDSLRRWYG